MRIPHRTLDGIRRRLRRDADGSFRRKIEAEKAELERRAFDGLTKEQIDAAFRKAGVK